MDWYYICVPITTRKYLIDDLMAKTEHKQFHGVFKVPSGDKITTTLFVMVFEDDNAKVAYCPALDIYGYGATEKEAKDSFEVSLDEYFSYTLNKGTLLVDLERLGWKCKSKHRLRPPTFTQLLSKNKEMSHIFNSRSFKKLDRSISISLPCS